MRKFLCFFCATLLCLQIIALSAFGVWVSVAQVDVSRLAGEVVSRYLPDTFRIRNQRLAWRRTGSSRRIWGYVNHHSVRPGEPFALSLSVGPGHSRLKGYIEISRIGHYGNGQDRRKVWQSEIIKVMSHGLNNTAAALGPNWPVAIEDVPTEGWQSGYHSIDFVLADGTRERNIAFIVVTNPARSGDVLVKLSTNTYQAYNHWGGHSFYRSDHLGERGYMISFDRPTPADFFRWEYYFVIWIEELKKEEGFTVDYITDFDLHRDKDLLAGYTLFVSVGHDEYWTKEEFDHVYARIHERGQNTLFLGANTAYWQVRYADVNRLAEHDNGGRQLICFKSLDDPIRETIEGDSDLYVTAKFRDGARRPETMLMGVGYESWFPGNKGEMVSYHVQADGHRLFEGTGYKKGDPIGNVIGYEWDNRDPGRDGNRLWDAEKSQIAELPLDSIQVLFSGKVIDHAGAEGKAEAVYFVSEAGAKVFSSGSIRWPWGLTKEGFAEPAFRMFNHNLVLDFLMPGG
jgi:hypothetical protein